MTENVIRLLIVDDHTLFREGLLAIFLAVSDIEVVGEASSGAEAVEKAQQSNPHVILMDIQMEDIYERHRSHHAHPGASAEHKNHHADDDGRQ